MRKTIGILAHVDAGKTTLSEAVLYHGKAIRAKGRVDYRDSFLDADAVEKQRGITVFSGQAAFSLGENQYYLVDTPGHADFAGEMERTLGVLDYAVLVVSAADGVRGRTEKNLWRSSGNSFRRIFTGFRRKGWRLRRRTWRPWMRICSNATWRPAMTKSCGTAGRRS